MYYSLWNRIICDIFKIFTNRQILVPRTSRGRLPPTSLGRPLKILFDRPGDVPIWGPGDILRWRTRDVLIWPSRDVPGRLIRDVPRMFSGRSFRVLKLGYLIFFLTFLSEIIRLTKSKSTSTLKMYWKPCKTSKMKHFLQN